MRVLLVNPRICSPRSVRLPLSLLALAAVLDGEHDYGFVDGNLDPDPAASVLRALAAAPHDLVAMTVMPGPQVAPAIALSRAVRAAHPRLPIAWGGYFPTLYPEAAINAPYVDYVVRGPGEETLRDLLLRLPDAGGSGGPGDSAADGSALAGLAGATWKEAGEARHGPDRPLGSPDAHPPLPYRRLGDLSPYLRPSFMGRRTAVHQAAVGCRYRCTFCGVASMFHGATALAGAARVERAARTLRDEHGADSLQLYDHNFFDRESTSVPVLEALARAGLPWWCYARADVLAGFSAATWKLVERSRLAMAYIGAEAASDEVLAGMNKGTRVEHTFEAVRRCREHGVVPELSFVLGGPDDPEEEVERTFRLIRRLKEAAPESEVVLYFYSPTPRREPASDRTRATGLRLPVLESYGPGGPPLPTTPEEWAEPRWVDYVCHRDAPWLTPRLRRRVRDFATVLGCRFPTVQDADLPAWGRTALSKLAGWRYRSGRWGRPWELRLARRALRLRQPQSESL
ncbi:MAG TPA: cobalamin-dependent protein [Thermoanaerobaculia bacterium]|nr:cobalamin-dependent protein [Thermoanaerobaculia bacterium]